MRIAVFYEFEGLAVLSNYCIVDIPTKSCITEHDSAEGIEMMKRNIKILFTGDTKDAAYKLKECLEEDGVATFVTDQLYITIEEKVDGKKVKKIVPLPKDRIIMTLTQKQ